MNDIYNILSDNGVLRSDYDKSHKKERQLGNYRDRRQFG
jgi:hypothetical protein